MRLTPEALIFALRRSLLEYEVRSLASFEGSDGYRERPLMGKKIVVTGRGGTGKTTFAALAVTLLPSSKLVVDADPDESLAAMMGVDLAASGVHTISEMLYGIQRGKAGSELQSMPLAEKVEYLLQLSCVYESAEFDLVSLGTKWTAGCYCAPNDILRTLIPQIADNYEFTIVDSPAGLEHLNRRVLPEAGDVFAVVDPSGKSLRNAEAVRDLGNSVGFSFDHLFLVANHRFPAEDVRRLREMNGATYLGKIEWDPAVEQYDWEGRSLLELPADSPALLSVGAVLEKAGYRARPSGSQ